ncbi:LuxR family transcriptional regulator [Mycolicibacterium aichiense]|uniref:Transcriptional regulator n=1 Tax=Mycolicibacterium aichiense TaxID=1799 RepID=A0AAD1HRZ9_9MYCO|nr:LuxR family transcriptional regulator [Mycolicibacterium aichiense]MCV7016931.1 AAA family ATPase [Mycolicibacterium aichiense]BBX10647.1 transcriptional regulator [Mycolicibacterium aichiense]STZ25696.1 transcriptional regulator, luxR family [Mycolicibacterium aichiense]
MGVQIVGRSHELQRVQAVLQQARSAPTAMILDGPAGIGKSTVWRAATDWARAAGFMVLTTTGAAAEAGLAWAGLADLLADIDDATLAGLPALHQRALCAVSTGESVPGGDERLVATAFRAAIEASSRRRPVLIAVDDAHWLDEATRLVLGFSVRRLSGPVGVVAAYRSGDPGTLDQSWVAPRDPEALSRVTVGPMSLGALHAVIATRHEMTPPRPTMVRIHSLSGGNPFYALELARGLHEHASADLAVLPPTLTRLLGERIGDLDPLTAQAAVTAATAAEPTVELVAAAIGRHPTELVEILQSLESRGVLAFDGHRIRFSHPLIASAIIADADPTARRHAHRCLANVIDNPELHARHLALATPYGDPETLAALDGAAESAAARGAYSVAAELVGLAIGLGGDTGSRRLRGAEFHFRAGALDEAEELIAPVVDTLSAGLFRALGLIILGSVRGYRDGMAKAVGVLQRAVTEAAEIPALRTQALLLLALATGLGGDMATCVAHARQARHDADETGIAALRSQALALWVHVSFMYGLGTDTEALRTALELEDSDSTVPATLQPTAVYAINCAWTGRLDEARTAMDEVARRCAERGSEVDVVWAAEQLTMIYIGLGRYHDAQQCAAEALERARQVDAQLPLISAYTSVAGAGAYRGDRELTRTAARQAIELAGAAQLTYLIGPPLMSLAFVEVSAGDYATALQTLQPLLAAFDRVHGTEIMAGAYLPDAVEALTAVGRADEAEPLVAALESNGALHDRGWMLATGARCRALMAAARGDLEAAFGHAERAMAHHDRLPMPFERARTLLLVGQLLRRRRRPQAAYEALRQAADVFTEIGSPLWASRAQSELDRLAARSAGGVLTGAERQVAEYAAAGMSNKQIATALYLSPKTVEMYLSNVYRKLGIRSRAQLAGRLDGTGATGTQITPPSAAM